MSLQWTSPWSLYKIQCSNQAALHPLWLSEGPVQGQDSFFIVFCGNQSHDETSLFRPFVICHFFCMKKVEHPVFTFVCQLDTIRSKSLYAGFLSITWLAHERLFDLRKVDFLKTIFLGYRSLPTHLILVCMYVDFCMVCWESKELKFGHFFLLIAQCKELDNLSHLKES